MKKIVAIMAFILMSLIGRSQSIINNQYSLVEDGASSTGKGKMQWIYQTDLEDFPIYYNYLMGWTDTTSMWIRALKSDIASVNTNTRLVGIANDGTIKPYNISALPKQTLTINSNSLSISDGNTVVIPTSAAPTPNSATRAINSATYTISNKGAFVNYSIRIQCNTTILLTAASGTVALQYSTNNQSSWVDVSQVENSLSGLIGENKQTSVLSGYIPGNATNVRMVTTIQSGAGIGSTTATFVRGQETY